MIPNIHPVPYSSRVLKVVVGNSEFALSLPNSGQHLIEGRMGTYVDSPNFTIEIVHSIRTNPSSSKAIVIGTIRSRFSLLINSSTDFAIILIKYSIIFINVTV